MPQPTALLWFRNDLRLADNPALAAACASGLPLLCLYIHDERNAAIGALGGASGWRLNLGLRALAQEIARRGGELHFLRGAAEQALPRLAEKASAVKIFWNRRYGAEEIAQDKQLKALLRASGREVASFNGALLAEPWEVATKDGGPFKVFTPFWRALRANLVPSRPAPPPEALRPAPWPLDAPPRTALADLALAPKNPDWAGAFPDPAAGEVLALQRLHDFLDRKLDAYAALRDRLDQDATSRLSAHLHFGEISPRQIFHAVSARGGGDKFLSELGWREFSYHLLFAFPDLASRNFNPRFDGFPWRRDEAALTAWKRGRTGYPVVDAGMRELWATGSMHNRARMVCASFLTKHLLIDWREGEAWFRDTLADADAANNSASWQWVGGSGADAAPFFRIFNPVLQGAKFDPDGAYVRRFCPELAGLPNSFIHRPWMAPPAVLAGAGFEPGRNYPAPLIDHDFARRRALAAFEQISGGGSA
nr:deoxyribodipyrimidine photo-lyase [uncultured Rhodoblastus sp.]